MQENLKELKGPELIKALRELKDKIGQISLQNETFESQSRKTKEEKEQAQKELQTQENTLKGLRPEAVKFGAKEELGEIIGKPILKAIAVILLFVIEIAVILITCVVQGDMLEVKEMMELGLQMVIANVIVIVTLIGVYFLFTILMDTFDSLRIIKSILATGVSAGLFFGIVTTIAECFVHNVAEASIVAALCAGGSLVVTAIIAVIWFFVKLGKFKAQKGKREESAEQELQERKEEIEKNIQKIKERIEELKAKEELDKEERQKIKNPKTEFAQVIHPEYIDVGILTLFIDYLEKGRADTLKECTNLFEQEKQMQQLKKDQEKQMSEFKQEQEAKIGQAKAELAANMNRRMNQERERMQETVLNTSRIQNSDEPLTREEKQRRIEENIKNN